MADPPLAMDDYVFDEDDLIQLSFLRDEETDALISADLLDDDLRLSSPLDRQVTFELPELALHVTAGELYPVMTPTWEVENKSFPREQTDALRRRLREITAEAEVSRNNLAKWRAREEDAFGIFSPAMVVVLLAEEVIRHINTYRANRSTVAGRPDAARSSKSTDKHNWFLSADAKQAVDISQFGSSTMRETAYQILQQTPAQIAAHVPSNFRVLHVEQVLRPDLAQDFQNFQARLRHRLSDKTANSLRQFMPQELRGTHRVEDMIDHLVRPCITFHGTQRQYVPSIVRHGFVLPGKHNPETGEGHDVRCGSTYGRGIYSSPSAVFSLSYSGAGCARTRAGEYFGLKLVVCATIMGRARSMYREDGWRQQDEAFEGADSHVANEGMEYIVFDRAQTIPVYVVHLDWGADNAEYFHDLPDDPAAWAAAETVSDRRRRAAADKLAPRISCPGDVQRSKEAVFARASKWFPYGFGPASGTRFVVEEVGEVSEDEEEYGEYQALRGDERDDIIDGESLEETNFWAWVKVAAVEEEDEDDGRRKSRRGKALEGLHLADEYGEQRKASKVPLGYRKKATDWDEMAAPGSEAEMERRARAKQDDGFHLDRLMVEDEADVETEDDVRAKTAMC